MTSAATIDDSPISEMNTTPLIDVMLVLLIMFIITIPPQTNAVKVDLPVPLASDASILQRNKLVVAQDGALLWNGASVSTDELRALLTAMAGMPNEPELHFEPDAEARYERVDQVLAIIKRANVAAMGFVGNERYAGF